MGKKLSEETKKQRKEHRKEMIAEMKYFEVEPPQRFRTGKPKRIHLKDCFKKAIDYVFQLPNGVKEEVKIVHGSFNPIKKEYVWGEHSWVELPGNIIFDGVMQRFYDKNGYYSHYNCIKEAEYTVKEADAYSGLTRPLNPATSGH